MFLVKHRILQVQHLSYSPDLLIVWLHTISDDCPVGWGCRIHSSNECSGYDTKQSDGEVPVILELWGM